MLGSKKGESIRHFRNKGEVRLGERALSVDRFSASTSIVYRFHGCFWHGRLCVKTAGVVNHLHIGKAMEELYRKRFRGIPTCLVWAIDWLLCESVSGSVRRVVVKTLKLFWLSFSTECTMYSSSIIFCLPLLSATFAVDGFLDWWSVISPFHHICVPSFL